MAKLISSKSNLKINPKYKLAQELKVDTSVISHLASLCPVNVKINSYFYSCDTYFSSIWCLVLLASMLIDDNLSYEHIEDLGYKRYKSMLGGKNNPYDFSTFEEDVIFSKDGSDVRDVLSLFQDWCANNKDKWKKIYSICNVNNINNPSKIFDLDDLFCEFEWEL